MALDVNESSRPPEPDDPRKPESPTDLTKPSLFYVLRKTAREFQQDQCTDLAAALTYYAVLSLFPALLVLVSLLGVVGQGRRTVDAVLEMAAGVVPGDAMNLLRPTIEQLVASPSAGVALITGALAALWSASGYVGAFGRAMNRIYEIDEGRPFYKLRPMMLLVTLLAVILAALVALMLVLTGPVAESVGSAIGLGDTGVPIWNIVKWPLMIGVVVLVVSILYYATPNIKQPKFRWISIGAGIAVLVWIVASVGFGFYVAHFSSYNKTYGSLAGVIVFLLWLWITNLALLFGAELDSEIERGRQLQAGIKAEEDLQLPPRDTKASDKTAAKDEKELAEARAIRLESDG